MAAPFGFGTSILVVDCPTGSTRRFYDALSESLGPTQYALVVHIVRVYVQTPKAQFGNIKRDNCVRAVGTARTTLYMDLSVASSA